MKEGGKLFLSSLSIGCVIFGFHSSQLKVLLLKMKHAKRWSLPGGFVFREENTDDAAATVLGESAPALKSGSCSSSGYLENRAALMQVFTGRQ